MNEREAARPVGQRSRGQKNHGSGGGLRSGGKRRRAWVHRFHRFTQIENRELKAVLSRPNSSMGFSGGAGDMSPPKGATPAPPLTSGRAGGRLRRAHAGWVGAHLWNLWFQLLLLKELRLSFADNQGNGYIPPLSSAPRLSSASKCIFQASCISSWDSPVIEKRKRPADAGRFLG